MLYGNRLIDHAKLEIAASSQLSMTVLFSLGLPSQFADWCDVLIARLADRALEQVALVAANTPKQVAFALINTEARNFVVSSRQPSHWLRGMLSDTGRRFILTLADPQQSVAHLVATAQLDWVRAVVFVGCCCAEVGQCLTAPGALVLRASNDPYATAQAIAQHLQLAVSADDIGAIVAELSGSDVDTAPAAGLDLRDNLPESGLAAASRALSPYVEWFRGNPIGQITWVRDLFYTDNQQPASHAIDITGRARYLIYGPYIAIPPGRWTAEVLLGFSQEATETTFIVDAFAGSQLTSASIQPPRQGVFRVSLNFEIAETRDALLEIRVMNERAAFDGKLALMLVVLSAQREIPPIALDEWERELELLTRPAP